MNPGGEGLDLGGGEAGAFGRHLIVRVGGDDALEEVAAGGVAGDDGVKARVGLGERAGSLVVAEAAILLVGAVAFQAMGGEDGLDVAGETGGDCGGDERGADEREDRWKEAAHGGRTGRGLSGIPGLGGKGVAGVRGRGR